MSTEFGQRPATLSDFLVSIVGFGFFGAFVSSVPLVNLLNACFCLWILFVGGRAVGHGLRQRPSQPELTTSVGMALSVGAITGALAGVGSSIFGFMFNLVFGSLIRNFYRDNLPRELRYNDAVQSWLDSFDISSNIGTAIVVTGVSAVFQAIVFGIFGAIGAFAAVQLFFKDRVR